MMSICQSACLQSFSIFISERLDLMELYGTLCDVDMREKNLVMLHMCPWKRRSFTKNVKIFTSQGTLQIKLVIFIYQKAGKQQHIKGQDETQDHVLYAIFFFDSDHY